MNTADPVFNLERIKATLWVYVIIVWNRGCRLRVDVDHRTSVYMCYAENEVTSTEKHLTAFSRIIYLSNSRRLSMDTHAYGYAGRNIDPSRQKRTTIGEYTDEYRAKKISERCR